MEEKERSVAPWSAEVDPWARWPFRGLARPASGLEDLWGAGRLAPAVDVTEDDDSYTLTAELPGAKKDDVTVELHDGMLTIRGEKRSEREEKDEQRRHVERRFGSFSRSFSLPANADADQIKAKFEDGVLTVAIHKREEAKPKTVDIKT